MERVNNDSLNFELMDLQIDCEKAKEIAADLSGYFLDKNPDTESFRRNYSHFGIFANIVFDYICEMNEKLEKLLEKEKAE